MPRFSECCDNCDMYLCQNCARDFCGGCKPPVEMQMGRMPRPGNVCPTCAAKAPKEPATVPKPTFPSGWQWQAVFHNEIIADGMDSRQAALDAARGWLTENNQSGTFTLRKRKVNQ